MLISMTQAKQIIEMFNGTTALSRMLGYKYPSTVQAWKTRGFIPSRHHSKIIEVGAANNITVRPEDFFIIKSNKEEGPGEMCDIEEIVEATGPMMVYAHIDRELGEKFKRLTKVNGETTHQVIKEMIKSFCDDGETQ